MNDSDIAVEKYQRYFLDPLGGDVLKRGSKGIACVNIRDALELLTDERPQSVQDDLFDPGLEDAVRNFQQSNNHSARDGKVGPGTRRLFTRLLLARFGPGVFARLQDPDSGQPHRAFISYAWADRDKVRKIQQWLRDHGILARRDEDWFTPGMSIPDNITKAIVEADRVIAVYSTSSRDRDWPRLELMLTEQLEMGTKSNVLVYLKLDDTPLPKHDPNRLAVQAGGRKLKDFGNEVLHAIRGTKGKPPHYTYDENEVF